MESGKPRFVVELFNEHARVPQKAHPTDACYDLYAPERQLVQPGETAAVDTYVALQLEPGWEAQIRGRSGLASTGVVVHFGTVDHLYRGHLNVILTNHSREPFLIEVGYRIAQLKFERVYDVELVQGNVDPTVRGGLGSTGM